MRNGFNFKCKILYNRLVTSMSKAFTDKRLRGFLLTLTRGADIYTHLQKLEVSIQELTSNYSTIET